MFEILNILNLKCLSHYEILKNYNLLYKFSFSFHAILGLSSIFWIDRILRNSHGCLNY